MTAAVAEDRFRHVLSRFATGVAIVTARDKGVPVGMTIQSLCSLSLRPPLILFCPGKASTTWPRIERGGRMCVNLLAETDGTLARQFATSGADKFASVRWSPSPATGSPLIEGAIGWIDSALAEVLERGDHYIAVCEVIDLAIAPATRPLVFYESRFRSLGA